MPSAGSQRPCLPAFPEIRTVGIVAVKQREREPTTMDLMPGLDLTTLTQLNPALTTKYSELSRCHWSVSTRPQSPLRMLLVASMFRFVKRSLHVADPGLVTVPGRVQRRPPEPSVGVGLTLERAAWCWDWRVRAIRMVP